MNKILVTIGIVTRNRPQYLLQAINSAIKQNSNNQLFEILVVDDASDLEEVKNLLTQVAQEGIRVICRKERGGEGSARNTLLKEMHGEFVMWLDDDDWLADTALFSHLQTLAANPHADVIYGDLVQVKENGEVLNHSRYQQIPALYLLHNLLYHDPIPNGGTLIRRSVFDKVGMYDPSFVRGTDYNIWTRIAASGSTFIHHPDLIYYYRSHSGNFLRGEDSPDFYPCMSRIVDQLLKVAPMERVFPMLPWEKDKQYSIAISMILVALAYLKWKDYHKALTFTEESLKVQTLSEGIAIRTLILKEVGKDSQAFAELFNLALGGNKLVSDIVSLCGLI